MAFSAMQGFDQIVTFYRIMAFSAMQGFDQIVTFYRILGVFILFGKVTSGGRNCGLFQKLHNIK